MPLDDTGASARAELAAINRELEAAAIVRDEARRAVDRLEKPTALPCRGNPGARC
jgi:hypothetical protein